MITPENLVQHEFIGLQVKILKSSNPQIVGLQGEVIDETRNMLILEVKTKMTRSKSTLDQPALTTNKQLDNVKTCIKKIAKDECVFLFKLPSGEKVKIDGKVIVARPEDRIKKKFRKW